MRVCQRQQPRLCAQRESREAKSRLPQASRLGFRLSWGKPAPEATRSARIWGCCRLTALLCRAPVHGHAALAQPARSPGAFALPYPSASSAKLQAHPRPLAGSPAGRRAPQTSWLDPARRRAAAGAVSTGAVLRQPRGVCLSDPAGRAGGRRRGDDCCRCRVLGRSPRRTGAQAGLVSQPAGGEGAQAGGRGAAAQG